MLSRLWLFCFLALLTTITQVNAKNIAELKVIQELPSNELKLRAFELIDPASLTDQIAACEYYVSFSDVLSNMGQIDEAKKILQDELDFPTHEYSHINRARLLKKLADIQYHNDEYDIARKTIKVAINHFRKSDSIELLTGAITRQASIELRTSNYQKGLDIVRAYHKNNKEKLNKENLASIYYFYGRAYDHLGDFQTSLEYKLKGYQIITNLEVSDNKMANTLYGIADSYNKIGEHQLSYKKFLIQYFFSLNIKNRKI